MTQSVTLMARVPAVLAQEVQAYAATHQVPISALVRVGLTYALTQPPPRPASPPAPVRPPRRPPWTLAGCLLAVLAQAPAGLSVGDCFLHLTERDQERLRRPGGYTSPVARVGATLRSLYRRGRIQRLGHGLYAPLS
jgi:hypothetical protein